MRTDQVLSLARRAAFLLVLAEPSLAQAPETSIPANLFEVGVPVVVTDTRGLKIRGTIESAAAQAVTITTGEGPRTIPMTDIDDIRRQSDGVWDGALRGLAIGALAGGVVGLSLDAARGEGMWLFTPVFIAGVGGGFLTGILGDALRPHDDILYRRPRSGVTFRADPVLSRHHIALQVAMKF